MRRGSQELELGWIADTMRSSSLYRPLNGQASPQQSPSDLLSMGEMTQNLAWMVWHHDSMVHRGSQELALGWIADKMHSSSLYRPQKGRAATQRSPSHLLSVGQRTQNSACTAWY